MSALKLFRRGGNRPSLKERAASLKATAGRVMRRPKPGSAEPEVDWHSPPPGFMAFPASEPTSFINIRYGLKLEAERLHQIALQEIARRASMDNVPEFARPGRLDQLRRQYRLAELERAASPERAIPTETTAADGTVYYEDASGKAYREPVADWIAFMAQRMNSAARQEVARLFDLGVVQDQDANDALYDKLRRIHRLDALHDLVHRADGVFEAAKESSIGRSPVSPRTVSAQTPDPILALIERHRQAYAEWFPFMEVASEFVGGTPEYARAKADESGPAEREQAAYGMILTARPTTPAGLIAWAGYLPQALAGNSVDPDEEGARALASMCDAVLSLVPITPARPACDLVDRLVSGWAEWAKFADDPGDPEEEAAWERATKTRDALLDAAGKLPATSESIPAKAVASAWLSFVSLWYSDTPREAYALDGRLVFDIDAAARAAKYGTAGEHPDAALIALGIELESADARMRVAEDDYEARCNAALAALPERPASLTFRESDAPLNLRREHCHPAAMEGSPVQIGDVEWMSRRPLTHEIKRPVRPGERAWHDHPGHVLEVVPFPEAQARADEIVAAWEAWIAAQQAVDEAHGLPEAEARCSAADAAVKSALDRLAALPAHTVDGMHTKLRAFQDAVPHMRGANWGDLMLRSLMRDAGVTLPETEA